jgi:hypothetical protein
MLEQQAGEDRGVAGVHVDRRSYLRTIQENLGEPAVLKPADACGEPEAAVFEIE